MELPVSTAAEEHRRVCGCRRCSQRDHSTGESVFYTLTKASAHSLHSQAILKVFGMTVEAVVFRDASVGIGIVSRQGCGRLKHLEVEWLRV